MKGRCYLLSLEKFWESTDGERYFREALQKVDVTRREKVKHMRTEKSKASCVGAGLLLQFAVQEALKETEGDDVRISTEAVGDMQFLGDMLSRKRVEAGYQLDVYTVPQVLKQLNGPLDLKMYYKGNGKPYLQDYPLYFNLSHSGNYVVCAVSTQEVGVDIQEYKKADVKRLARRFFSGEEQSILMACANEKEQNELFYQLWTRKEAYGKLTGEGIAAVIDKSVLPLKKSKSAVAEDDTQLFWQEWELDGYAITLCQYGIK